MQSIKSLIQHPNSKSAKIFDITIQIVIVISLISFSVETLPGLDPLTHLILQDIEAVCVGIFTIEYLIRFWATHNRKKFFFSFFGMVDLISILPFYLTTGLDLSSLRAFRFLRVIRIFKLARYNKTAQRLYRAFFIVREELVLFFFLMVIVVYLAGVGIYYFEHPAQPEVFQSVFHSLWWAVATLTTVGYGDIYPITLGGKVFTFFILLVGLGIISLPAGMIASALTRASKMEEEEKYEDD